VAIGVNVALLALKASATGLSDSLTIYSETLNSLADVASAVVIVLCIRWAWQTPDEDHPFGHRRAEPLAGLVVAIFTGILGFEVCKSALLNLWTGQLPERIGPYPIVALCVAVVVKLVSYFYFAHHGRKLNSPALRATAVDCRNDVLVAFQGLVAVTVAELRLPLLDNVAALLVGLYIFYSAHRIGVENIDYLMGRAPGGQLLAQIRGAANDVAGVHRVTDIRAHYVGTIVHVELTAKVDGRQSTDESHALGTRVREAVEAIGSVDRAFVHVEPVDADD
jgi:cation diffusion facilitator family transporter